MPDAEVNVSAVKVECVTNRLRGYGHVKIIWGHGIGRQSLYDTISIRITVEVVVEGEDVYLNIAWPLRHDLLRFVKFYQKGSQIEVCATDLKLPGPVTLVLHVCRNALIVTPGVVWATNQHLGNTSRDSIAKICMDYVGG
jgi:hypothetical protein